MNIGFIGTGVIATAMIHGIAADDHQIFITERSKKNSHTLSDAYFNVTIADSQAIIDKCEAIFVCLMADVARELLPTLKFRADQHVFSAMVGITHEQFGALVAPAKDVSIVIPFPFVAQGGSPLLSYPASEMLDAIFGGRNHIVPLADEASLNSYLAAQAVLSPTVKLIHETNQWLAARTGDEANGERFLRILIGGYLTAVDYEQTAVLPAMLQDLSTEGGLNAQLRDYFAEQGVYQTLQEGLNQLETRLTSE